MIAAAILAELAAQPAASSIDPSDVARRLAGGAADWRRHLGTVRRTAIAMQAEGHLTILRHGKPVAGDAVKGVIRLARGH
jgi:hypothetical protein